MKAIFTFICLIMLSLSLSASTAITTYGTVTSITNVYGSGGLVNHIVIGMDNLDGSGSFVYICRRPNLAPCTSAMIGVQYQFYANMTNWCTATNKICGEGTIGSLIPLSQFRPQEAD